MSRLNRISSDAVKSADRVAIVFYEENLEGQQYAIATFSNLVHLCSDGSGLVKLYPSRAKALDAIRRLNKRFSASNVELISHPDLNIDFKFITDHFRHGGAA